MPGDIHSTRNFWRRTYTLPARSWEETSRSAGRHHARVRGKRSLYPPQHSMASPRAASAVSPSTWRGADERCAAVEVADLGVPRAVRDRAYVRARWLHALLRVVGIIALAFVASRRKISPHGGAFLMSYLVVLLE